LAAWVIWVEFATSPTGTVLPGVVCYFIRHMD